MSSPMLSPNVILRVVALITGLSLLLGACVPVATPSSAPAAAPTMPAGSQGAPASIEGQWGGAINVGPQKIGIIVKFQGSGSDFKGWIDIPEQSIKGAQLDKPRFEAPKLSFEAFAPRTAVFEGELQADGTISGKFKQGGYEGTFTLKQAAISAEATVAVPYRQEEVTFKNGEVNLAGTLTLPQSGGPFPAVVLISGSGQQDRNEEVMGFPAFRLIADHLTRSGIAVLRYDDRGIGGSTGDVANATSEDFATDVIAAVTLLKSRTDINPKQIGLLGHSEGGIIAPMVASRAPQDIAFVIMLAGPGLPGDAVLLQQVGDILAAQGATQSEIDQARADQKRLMEVIRTGQGLAELQAEWLKKVQEQIAALPDEQKKALGDLDKAAQDAVAMQTAQATNPWIKFFITYDPVPALEQLQVPVLALFGGKDVQVKAEPNAQAVQAALEKGKNGRGTVKTYPGANHLFQPAKSGSIAEYRQLKEFVPGLLDDITQWIGQVAG